MNVNNSILLIEPTFDPSMASVCTLLIKIGIDSFSYAIVNKSTQKVFALYDEQECTNSLLNLTERFKTNTYLTLPFLETRIAIYSEEEINIPTDLFNEYSVELHSKLFNNNSDINLFSQKHFKFATLFGLNKSLKQIVTSQLNNAKVYPHTAGLMALAEDATNSTLFLDFSATSFTVIYVKNQQPIFRKSYETVSVEELNYFILLIINQLDIQTEEVVIQLSGIIHNDDAKHQCLQKYFSQMEFITISSDLDVKVLADMPPHYYTSLLALSQCV